MLRPADRGGKLVGDHFTCIAPLPRLEELADEAQLPQLELQHPLPDQLDPRMSLLPQAAPVGVDLGRLVEQPLGEPALLRRDERLVLRDVLLLDRGDLGVELTGDRVAEERPDVHVVVVRLVLGRDQGIGVQLGEGMRRGRIVRPAQVVERMPVLDHRRPAGSNVRVRLRDVVRIAAFQAVVERCVSVQMVEVFEEPESVRLRQVRIRFLLRDVGGELDGDLLVAQRGLEGRLVRWMEPVHQRLLLLLDPPDPRQRLAQLAVHARGDMQEPELLALDSVHQDDADASEGVDVELAVGTADHLLPAQGLVVERNATFLDDVEGHGWAPVAKSSEPYPVDGDRSAQPDALRFTRRDAERAGFYG